MILLQFLILLTGITAEVFSHSRKTNGTDVKKIFGEANIQKIQESSEKTLNADKSVEFKKGVETVIRTGSDEDNFTSHPFLDFSSTAGNKEIILEQVLSANNSFHEPESLSLEIREQKQQILSMSTEFSESSGMNDSIFYSNDIFASGEGSGTMAEFEQNAVHPPAPPTSAELRSATFLPYPSESIETAEGSGMLEEQSGITSTTQPITSSPSGSTMLSKILDSYVLSPFEKTVVPPERRDAEVSITISSIKGYVFTTLKPRNVTDNDSVSSGETSGNEMRDAVVGMRWHPYVFDCKTEEDEKGMLCKEWAQAGFCLNNRPTMFLFCRMTCLCKGPEKASPNTR